MCESNGWFVMMCGYSFEKNLEMNYYNLKKRTKRKQTIKPSIKCSSGWSFTWNSQKTSELAKLDVLPSRDRSIENKMRRAVGRECFHIRMDWSPSDQEPSRSICFGVWGAKAPSSSYNKCWTMSWVMSKHGTHFIRGRISSYIDTHLLYKNPV